MKWLRASLNLSKTTSISLKRSARLQRLLTFTFPFFNGTVFTGTFQVRNLVNRGEIIVSQRRGAGSITPPVVRYQIVNAVTGIPVTNSVTLTGTLTVALSFHIPAGTYKLRITNIGAGAASVQGVIVVF